MGPNGMEGEITRQSRTADIETGSLSRRFSGSEKDAGRSMWRACFASNLLEPTVTHFKRPSGVPH